MEELYSLIEEKIHAAGYGEHVSGQEIYDEICDGIEGKENGTYLFLAKRENGDVFEYKVDVMEENFNLSYVRITTGHGEFHVDFDL